MVIVGCIRLKLSFSHEKLYASFVKFIFFSKDGRKV